MIRNRNQIVALMLSITVAIGMLFPSVVGAQGATRFMLVPESGAVVVGSEFDVTVQIDAGENPVNSASVHLDFDPAVVEVVSLTPGDALPTALERLYDNEAGTIDYTAGVLGDSFTGIADFVTIRFMAKATGDAGLVFVDDADRDAMILAGAGEEVLGAMDIVTVTVVDGKADIVMSPETAALEVGEQVNVEVSINAAISVIRGDINLTFDPTILQVVSATPDTSGFNIGAAATFDNTAGTIGYDGGSIFAPSGLFPILDITFLAVGEGDGQLAVVDNSEIIGDGVNVLDQTYPTLITVGTVDNLPPVVTLEPLDGDVDITLIATDPYVEPGFSALDNFDGEIPAEEIAVDSNVDVNTPGAYTITYTATDTAGNEGTATRNVTVVNPPSAVQMAAQLGVGATPGTLGEGDTFTVDVMVQTAERVTDAAGYLSFDPAVLNVVTVTPGTILPTQTVPASF
ncbi:MAG: cohesin domain-containing protein, partial [Chloroflexota bacterium]